jgi:hypothetical protein
VRTVRLSGLALGTDAKMMERSRIFVDIIDRRKWKKAVSVDRSRSVAPVMILWTLRRENLIFSILSVVCVNAYGFSNPFSWKDLGGSRELGFAA